MHRLGVDPIVLGAMPIDHVAVYSSARSVTADLPFRALSLSRYRLDGALLDRAQDRGAQVKRNVSVRNVTPDGGAWNVECDDGEAFHCRHLVVATGKLGLPGVGDARDNSLVGLKMHLRPTAEIHHALTGRIELFLLNRSYVGLELVEDGIANLCCVLRRATVARLAPGWPVMRDYFVAEAPTRFGAKQWPSSAQPAAICTAKPDPRCIALAIASHIFLRSPATGLRSRSVRVRSRPSISRKAARRALTSQQRGS